jgi:hypothetical protein
LVQNDLHSFHHPPPSLPSALTLPFPFHLYLSPSSISIIPHPHPISTSLQLTDQAINAVKGIDRERDVAEWVRASQFVINEQGATVWDQVYAHVCVPLIIAANKVASHCINRFHHKRKQ